MYLLLVLTLLAQTPTAEYNLYHTIEQGQQGDRFYVRAYVSIPNASLQFTRKDSGYVSRYHLVLQLIDRRKNLYGAERFGEVDVPSSEDARSATLTVTDTLQVFLPEGAYEGNLQMEVLGTTRRIEAEISADIEPRALGSMLLTDQNGEFLYTRPFENADTLQVSVAVYEAVDSVVLAMKLPQGIGSRRVWQGEEGIARWEIPLVGLASADYEVAVTAFGEAKKIDEETSTFRLRVPFRLDVERYHEMVDKLVYIASNAERAELMQLPADRREAAWDSFWQTKDPTPQTEYNEVMEDYFARIEYCERNFSFGDRGYLSDRAKVYMTYGPPDDVEDHPFDMNRYPYIIWTYDSGNMQFIFEDRMGFGEYVLVYPQGFM